MRRTFLVSLLLAAASAVPGPARAGDYDLPAQPLDQSLLELAEISGQQIIFAEDLARNIAAPQVVDTNSLSAALSALLDGTGLEYTVRGDVIVIRPVAGSAESAAMPVPLTSAAADLPETVVVTGTRLDLHPSAMARQVIVIRQEDIILSGEPTLARALERLPQNFGGLSVVAGGRAREGAPPDTVAAANGALNVNAAESISLRGLGDNNTLYLVNGKRRAQAGLQAGSKDISGIPVNAVKRIEIILDGASAIYGSDAVGGVVNIILKDGEDGMSAGIRHATPSAGGNSENRLEINGGHAWDTGRAFGALSITDVSELTSAEVEEFTPFGSPGTVYSRTAGGLSPRPLFNTGSPPAVFFLVADSPLARVDTDRQPLSFNGNTLLPTSDDFVPGSVPATEIEETLSLVPRQRSTALVGSIQQELGERWQLSIIATHSDADVVINNGVPPVEVYVPADSPWNPFGEGVKVGTVYPALGTPTIRSGSLDTTLQASLSRATGGGWTLDASTSFSRNKVDSTTTGLWDTAEPAISGNFNPWGDGFEGNEGPRDVFDFNCFCLRTTENYIQTLTTGNDSTITSENRTMGLDLVLKGAGWHMAAGSLGMVFGAEGLRTNWQSESDVQNPAAGSFFQNRFTYADVRQDQAAAFSEISVPLVSPDMDIPLVRKLGLTGALRFDHFAGRGDTLTTTIVGTRLPVSESTAESAWTWSLGSVWDPADRLRIRANVNTSFSMPKFVELYRAQFVGASSSNALLPGLPAVPFYTLVQGGNPDLQPTESEALGLSVEWTLSPGLKAGIYYHDIKWKNKIVNSLIPMQLVAGRLFAENGGDAGATMNTVANLFPNLVELDGNGNLATLRAVLFNLDSEVARGLDATIQWDRALAVGHLSVDATISRAIDHFQRLDVGLFAGNEELIGIRRPKTRGLLRSSLFHGRWTQTIDVSYTARTISEQFYARNRTGYVTGDLYLVNLQTNYALGGDTRPGLVLRAGINNLFDRFPATSYWLDGSKLADTPIGSLRVGDPRGRTVYVSIDFSF